MRSSARFLRSSCACQRSCRPLGPPKKHFRHVPEVLLETIWGVVAPQGAAGSPEGGSPLGRRRKRAGRAEA
eukprot:13385360-Alexandrium_andersonii.AAC.1